MLKNALNDFVFDILEELMKVDILDDMSITLEDLRAAHKEYENVLDSITWRDSILASRLNLYSDAKNEVTSMSILIRFLERYEVQFMGALVSIVLDDEEDGCTE